MSMMNVMQQKFASLERKISKMTSNKWNTEREIKSIEQLIKADHKKAIIKEISAQKLKRRLE